MHEPTKKFEAEGNGQNATDETLALDAYTISQESVPVITGYRVVREIARGGMGRVFEAIDLKLDRLVAIKTILRNEDSHRFKTESRITAQLPHPSIPPVYDFGHASDGTPFLAMKRIDGVTLDSQLKNRTYTADETSRFLQIAEQVSHAVGFAHSQGVIHRDLKPQNVMVGSFGEIQVMDWGLAKRVGATELNIASQSYDSSINVNQHTIAGLVMGTPGYMAPEQARGEQADFRSDVFAIGSILLTLLTGRPAFVGSSAIETINLASQGKLDDALNSLAKSDIPPELQSIVSRCVAIDPIDRYQNGLEIANALNSYRNGLEQRLRSMEVEFAVENARRKERGKRIKALGALAVIALLLVSFAYWSSGHFASVNKRVAADSQKEAAIAIQKSAQANEEAASIDSKMREQELQDQLRKLIREQAEQVPEICRTIKLFADSRRNASPLPGFSLRKNSPTSTFYVGLDSHDETFFATLSNSITGTNYFFRLRRYIYAGHPQYPSDAGIGDKVAIETNYIVEKVSGDTSAKSSLIITTPGESASKPVIRDIGAIEVDSVQLQILSDRLGGFVDAFDKNKSLIPSPEEIILSVTDDALSLKSKGMLLFGYGEWEKAAEVFRAWYDSNYQITDLSLYECELIATLFLYVEDKIFYKTICEDILERSFVVELNSPFAATSATCLTRLLVADPGERSSEFQDIPANITMEASEGRLDSWGVLVKALSEYRNGNYQDSIDSLTNKGSGPELSDVEQAIASSILAMSNFRAEYNLKAEKQLAMAKWIVEQKRPNPKHEISSQRRYCSHFWLQAEILVREAEALLEFQANKR